MKLLGIENSRLIALFVASRDGGQPHLPTAMRKLVERYSFASYPTKIEELDASKTVFRHGAFNGVGIESLEVYSDGLIVSTKAPTEVLDAFVDDLRDWMFREIGLRVIETHLSNRAYESSLLFQTDVPLLNLLEPLKPLQDMLSKCLKSAVNTDAAFQAFGFSLAADHAILSGMKPIAFRVERRIGSEFELNYYLSQAPIPTPDHLKVLERLEKLVR